MGVCSEVIVGCQFYWVLSLRFNYVRMAGALLESLRLPRGVTKVPLFALHKTHPRHGSTPLTQGRVRAQSVEDQLALVCGLSDSQGNRRRRLFEDPRRHACISPHIQTLQLGDVRPRLRLR